MATGGSTLGTLLPALRANGSGSRWRAGVMDRALRSARLRWELLVRFRVIGGNHFERVP